uniref:Uncharacterized protein n=1 Tax=Polytomella parva TaxID=51329 RepID=A0A7S0YCW1_9CHLO|mmetsp:Transcript_18174/g.33202  ORF Transcript_18174/g.33202 Transcript_18174/m.33202 type:complete len:337 (+) Transcript_18174:126-1136(+)|eukprot:CAMPEP_0175038694 /NCGR_PEP_ID=MMETSP0052_2-20121109/18_1 /TAXON_ID=51329 ORGANISM="Polytomella parva, Strain SAG 63-3" /NCGR_SAMPLE_ID=MMETSP0052_2 /ASSEMBLY_ACC=CAM_ASM_000194 /LENGTH=336 /DNA_ID=CAMNT_0016300159 /DNA_START=120 /DNA_END=1130 /DNA_ORIENTATION=+
MALKNAAYVIDLASSTSIKLLNNANSILRLKNGGISGPSFRRTFSSDPPPRNDGEKVDTFSMFSSNAIKRVLFPMKEASKSVNNPTVQTKTSPIKRNSFQVGASQASKVAVNSLKGKPEPPALSKTHFLPPKMPVSALQQPVEVITEVPSGSKYSINQLTGDSAKITRMLFKLSMLFFTIPFAITVVARGAFTYMCVNGFESKRHAQIRRTLRQVRSIVRYNFVASWFESNEGVLALMNIFRPGMEEATLEQFIITCRHLLRFPATRKALVDSNIYAAVDAALEWAPDSQKGFLVELRKETLEATTELSNRPWLLRLDPHERDLARARVQSEEVTA